MKIFVKTNDGNEQEFKIDKKEIIIGRSSDCDIVLNSDNVSRKHLKIVLKEEKIYISDITSSNWISYNDEKLKKNIDVEYFDFMQLVLPDEITIKIKNTVPLKQKDYAVPKRDELESHGEPENRDEIGHVKKKEREKSKSMRALLLVFVGTAAVVGLLYFKKVFSNQGEVANIKLAKGSSTKNSSIREEVVETVNPGEDLKIDEMKQQILKENKRAITCNEAVSKK
ncbi:MAG: hypothetical protein ACJAS4_002524 [Bacteriovoracaceae bacterium]|jgi:hypothetical protein